MGAIPKLRKGIRQQRKTEGCSQSVEALTETGILLGTADNQPSLHLGKLLRPLIQFFFGQNLLSGGDPDIRGSHLLLPPPPPFPQGGGGEVRGQGLPEGKIEVDRTSRPLRCGGDGPSGSGSGVAKHRF